MMVNPFRSPYGGGGDNMVPNTFAPSVTEGETPMSPATAPMIRPMRNAAPGEMQQTGQTLEQAGAFATKLGNTIGDRVQETMDDATTKAAENQFLQSSLPVLSQYRTTEGVNATQQFEPAAQAIMKAREDARSTLTNPIQQRMFDQVTNGHVFTFGQQMADHENVQRVEYGKQQSSARADSLNTMSTLDVAGRNRDDSNFAKYGAQSDAEVLHYAALSGIAPDSPQADEMLRKNRTQRYASVISSLLDQHAYNEAGDFFTAHKGEMDIQAAERLGNAVKSATQAEQVTEFRNQAVESLHKTPGAGPLSPPIPAGTITTTPGIDGIDIHAAPGASVHAPASGTVTKVWTDPEHGLSAQVTLPNGYTATFSGLSAVNYKEGQKITQGQVLGLSGQDDARRAVTHYAMNDPAGQFIDPRQAVSAPFDPKNFSSPDDEEKAVQWINAHVSDPVMQREAEGQVRSLASTNRQIGNQQHAAALKQATDWVLQHNGSLAGLPTDVKMQLTPEDMLGFAQKGQELYHLGQEALTRNEVNLLASWNANPATQTVDAVRQAYAQGKLSDASYQRAIKEAATYANSPERVKAAEVDQNQIENTLIQNGLSNIANAKPAKTQDDAKAILQSQKVAITNEIKDQIDAEQQVTQRALTRDQKQKIIDSVILNNAATNNSKFLSLPGKTNAAPWDLTPALAAQATYTSSTGKTVHYRPITVAERAFATQSLLDRRQPVTERNIYDTLVNAGAVQ